MSRTRRRLLLIAALLTATGGAWAIIVAARRPPPVVPIPVTPAVVRETWRTTAPHGETDSLAVYRDEQFGRRWLIATDKHGDRLQVFDARNARHLRDVGTSGDKPGEFRRPNGICVFEPLPWLAHSTEHLAFLKKSAQADSREASVSTPVILVVERDAHRLGTWALPDFTPYAWEQCSIDKFSRPYGIAAGRSAKLDREFAFVTDNDRSAGGQVLRFSMILSALCGNAIGIHEDLSFGDQDGNGQLRFVESIAYDPQYARLYICDESPWSRNVKVYSEQGVFSGMTFGEGYITDEPEGIALWPEGDGGWIILTNQGKELSTFHFFDRRTFKHVGCFIGEPRIANTDGIAVTQGTLGPLAGGALYAVDNDGPVAAYAWNDIARALKLDSVFLKESPAASQDATP